MCGRYGFSVTDIKQVYKRFEVVNELTDFKPRYNIALGQMNPVITKQSPNKIQRMFWRLIPSWAKDKSISFHTINARAEDIDKKPTFKKPLRCQRCLIPATGFYEWKKTVSPSIPYYFQLKDKLPFAFAGVYDIWKGPDFGQELYSYTIITTAANKIVALIHPRMPVILQKEDEEQWLNPDIDKPEKLLPLLQPYPADNMASYMVSRNVNNISLDNEELIKPLVKPPE